MREVLPWAGRELLGARVDEWVHGTHGCVGVDPRRKLQSGVGELGTPMLIGMQKFHCAKKKASARASRARKPANPSTHTRLVECWHSTDYRKGRENEHGNSSSSLKSRKELTHQSKK